MLRWSIRPFTWHEVSFTVSVSRDVDVGVITALSFYIYFIVKKNWYNIYGKCVFACGCGFPATNFFCCMYIDCTHTHVVNMADSPRKTQTKVTRRTSSAINLAAGEKGVHKMNGIEAIGQEHKGNEDTIFNKWKYLPKSCSFRSAPSLQWGQNFPRKSEEAMRFLSLLIEF